MSETRQEQKREGWLEKHVQTLLLSVVTALLIGGFTKISNMFEIMVKLEERDKSRTEQLSTVHVTVTKLNLDVIDMRIRITKLEEQIKQYYSNSNEKP